MRRCWRLISAPSLQLPLSVIAIYMCRWPGMNADLTACWTVCSREYQLEVAASCGGNQRNVRWWRRFGGASFHLHDSPRRGFGLLWRWMQQTLRKCCIYIQLYIASYDRSMNVWVVCEGHCKLVNSFGRFEGTAILRNVDTRCNITEDSNFRNLNNKCICKAVREPFFDLAVLETRSVNLTQQRPRTLKTS